MSKGMLVAGVVGGLVLGLLVAFVFSGVLSVSQVPMVDKASVDGAYASGLSEGDALGYERGLTVGNSSGYSSGYESGYTVGYASVPRPTAQPAPPDRYNDGYSAGFSSGKSQGYSEGFSVGNNSGFTVGFDSGVVAGARIGYNIRDPTYNEMMTFLANDKTDENVYDEDFYYCFHFTKDVLSNAFDLGFKAGFVYIEFFDGAHAIVCFDTVDYGVVYVEPQTDEVVTLVVGEPYGGQEDLVVEYFMVVW